MKTETEARSSGRPMDFTGRVVVITGGTVGMGYHFNDYLRAELKRSGRRPRPNGAPFKRAWPTQHPTKTCTAS